MRTFNQDLQRIFEHQNFISSLADDITCPQDLQAIGRVLLLIARRIDALTGRTCDRCPYPGATRHGRLTPA